MCNHKRYSHPGDEFECFANTAEELGVYQSDVDRALQDRAHKEWLKRWKKGPPMATSAHTVAELESMGMFGLYRLKGGSGSGITSSAPES